jgi:hypothetical protein
MNCLDEGLLQALNDGELSADARRAAEAHLASCPSCAAAAGEAAQEFALFSQALAFDEPLNVPTERLRANIASAVAEMQTAQATERVAARESSGGRVRSFWSSLAASLAPRQVAVFAGLAMAAVVLAVTLFALRPGSNLGKEESQEMAKGNGPSPRPSMDASVAQPTAAPTVVEAGPQGESGGGIGGEETAKNMPGPTKPDTAKIRPKGPGETGKFRPKNAGVELAAKNAQKFPGRPNRGSGAVLLLGERQYVSEIAALKTSIERRKLETLSPTLRAEYERNVAVVDEAIASTRAAVKSNPKDRDAQEFLRSAYQEKLDLLSAVAGKSQLASADR